MESFEEKFWRYLVVGAHMRARFKRLQRRIKPHTKLRKNWRRIREYEGDLRDRGYLAPPLG